MKSLPSTPSPQEPRRLKTRAALIAAGAELLSRRPIDAIAVNDIVDAASVAKGSFFNHFEDKDAFAAAIAAEIRADIEARVTAANVGVSDPGERVARAICGFVQFTLVEPKRARIMLRGHSGAIYSDHPLNRGLKSDIASGVRTGHFRRSAAKAGVAFVVGVCHVTLSAVLGSGLKLRETRKFAKDMLVLVLTGLGVDEAEAGTISSRTIASVIVGDTK